MKKFMIIAFLTSYSFAIVCSALGAASGPTRRTTTPPRQVLASLSSGHATRAMRDRAQKNLEEISKVARDEKKNRRPSSASDSHQAVQQ